MAVAEQLKAEALRSNEAERLVALRSFGVLDTPIEPAFDDITRIASFVCDTPVAVISFIDAGRLWFKSEIGLGTRELPIRPDSIGEHAVLEHLYLEVRDIRTDKRFESGALIRANPQLCFYASALLRTPDGLPLGTLSVLDVKPRRMSDDQREILAALARQVMSQLELRRALFASDRLQRNVSRLMAVAGHDLKQPLQVMVMAIDRVRGKLADARDRERLGYAVDAGMRMAEDLDRLAETSALQTDFGMPRPRTFPISDIFRSIVSTWRMHAEAKSLQMVVVPSTARVISDPAMLRAIIGNLVGNAIKYTERGRVLVGCRRRGHNLSIEVLDTGAGIAPDQQKAIFEAFHQIDPDSEGLGLGLSIVRRTAEALAHVIELKSDVARGTHFTVLVPLALR